jgi:hypothetical protein
MRRLVVVTGLLALVAGGMVDAGAAGGQTVPPTIAVAPFSDLVHRQEVRVGGFGFAPHSQLAFSQCVAGVNDITDCDLSTSKFVQANQYGAFKSRTIVKRLIIIDDEIVDCAAATGTCVIGGGYPDGSAGDQFPLHFDPEGPLPSPSVTVTPNTGLVHKHEVEVKGSGFTPGASVAVMQCPTASDPLEHCVALTSGPVEPPGEFTMIAFVRREFRTSSRSGNITWDCTVSSCVLRVFNFQDALERVHAPLGFDPSAPVPPPLPVTVAPDEDLADGQIVNVSGTGFTVGEELVVRQCVAGADPIVYPSSCGSYQSAIDEGSGFTVPVRVRRDLFGVDCAAAAGACEIVVGASDPFEIGRAPLDFDPAAEPITPDMKARPRRDLHPGQVVTVTGAGFSPNAPIVIAQCKFQPSSQADCAAQHYVQVQSDAQGAFSTPFTVRGHLKTANGIVSCKASPGACVIGGSNVSSLPSEEQDRAAKLIFATD